METAQDSVESGLLIEQSPDATVFAGLDGVIRVWNAAAERVFGFPAVQAVGQDLNIIIPESLRDAHWTGYDRALAAGDTKYRGQSMPTKALRADGSQIYVELSFAIVKDGAGTVVGALAQARDITQRFENERTMRRRLRDLEAELAAAREGPTTPAA